MASLTQIRAGIVGRLRTIGGLYAYPRWPNRVDFPAAIVTFTGQGLATQDDGHTLRGRVIVLSAPAEVDYEAGQAKLDPYLEPDGGQSVMAAIEADPALGGLDVRINVTGWDSYSANWQVGQVEAFGAAVNFEVYR